MAILHVEDQAVIRDVVRRALAARGFTVVAAESIAAAKLLVSERADLTGVLLDVRLRDGSGIDLYEWIVERRPGLAARVAFLTGSADADAHGSLAKLGRPVLGKPFDITDLWRIASEWERGEDRGAAADGYDERRVDA
jgi:DNA-binding NtrC family response regulator